MNLLLTAVLLAAAVPLHTETITIGTASDGTPFMRVPQETVRGMKAAARAGREDGRKASKPAWNNPLGMFGYEFIPVPVRTLEGRPKTHRIATVNLDDSLDAITKLQETYWQFNRRLLHASFAFDRNDNLYFGFFTGKTGEEVLVSDRGTLLIKALPAQLDPETMYYITLQLDIFDPVKSWFVYTPARGVPGKTYKVQADKALQLIQNAGLPVFFEGSQMNFYYITDADPGTNKLAKTRRFCFFKQEGKKHKAFSIPSELIPVGKWVSADLGGQPAILFLSREGTLLIHEPN